MKKCSKCGETKSTSEFYKRKGKVASICKECAKAQQKQWYEKHKKKSVAAESEKRRRRKEDQNKRQISKCSRCIYRTHIGEGERDIACYYCGFTGKRRGCEAGDKCDKFVEGQQIRKKEFWR